VPVLASGNDSENSTDDEGEFRQQRRRKRKQQGRFGRQKQSRDGQQSARQQGTATQFAELPTVDPHVRPPPSKAIFASGFAESVTDVQLEAHLTTNGIAEAKVVSLKTRYPNYSSFYITVPDADMENLTKESPSIKNSTARCITTKSSEQTDTVWHGNVYPDGGNGPSAAASDAQPQPIKLTHLPSNVYTSIHGL
jgi:hypothetical protein